MFDTPAYNAAITFLVNKFHFPLINAKSHAFMIIQAPIQ